MKKDLNLHSKSQNSSVPEEKTIQSNGKISSNNGQKLIDFKSLNKRFEGSHPDKILSWGFDTFGKDMVLGTGFGPSGVLLIHRLVTQNIPVNIFYLDTHLLFKETYHLRDVLEDRFDIEIIRVSTTLSLDAQSEKYGPELWQSDPDACCNLRKVLPLKTYLSEKKAWVTGVRRNQATTRKQTEVIEWDPMNDVVKINPLAAWKNEEVWDYIKKHQLPYNPLHDHGYPTIGCIPCTEPMDTEKDERSGRWKDNVKTECGIHLPTQKWKSSRKS